MNYLQIDYEDVCNGEGMRVTLWISGCSHRCRGCHNPQTWNPCGGIVFDAKAKQRLFDELAKSYVAGITLTGGDPLHENNLSEVFSLVKEIRSTFPQKNIWLYTGYTWEGIMCSVVTTDFNPERDLVIDMRKQVIHNIDILVDGKYKENERDLSLAFRGSRNQRVIDVQASLKQGKVVLYME